MLPTTHLRPQSPRTLPQQIRRSCWHASPNSKRRSLRRPPAEVIELSDQRVLQDVGIYRYHHPLENAAAYKEQLAQLEGQIDAIVKSGRAVLAADLFTFDGSLAKGRKMVADLSKLMLRAYNAEADNCVRSLRSGNISTATKRLSVRCDRDREARRDHGHARQPRVPRAAHRRTRAHR